MKAKIETTKGSIEVELFELQTPQTVRNFVELARSGFYDNLVFHRIVKGFVIQTGDPNTRNCAGNKRQWGIGVSGKNVPLEIVPTLRNDLGTLGMARSKDPNSASSQFFINLSNNNSLDGNYAIFGRVTNGMNVALEIADVSVDQNDVPLSPADAMMRRVSIQRGEKEF
jgi:peptidyl-prolyl cis-trans isomerase B (cyclophilin B)